MVKTLMLMRHGDYRFTGVGNDDSLSGFGQWQASHAARLLMDHDYDFPDIILHSPLKRAVETAEKMRETFYKEIIPEITGRYISLVPEEWLLLEKRTNVRAIQRLSDEFNTVLAISHDPNIAKLMSLLTGKRLSPDKAEIYILDGETSTWASFERAKLIGTLKPTL